MTRVLKILSYAVVMFLVYLLVLGVFNKLNNSTQADDPYIANDVAAEEGEFFDDDVDLFGIEEDNYEPVSSGTVIDYNEIDRTIEKRKEETKPKATPVSTTDYTSVPVNQSPVRMTSSTGEFMVIAGNYIMHSNAGGMANKLKQMGFSSAEIVVFDLSQYHSVVASRTDDYDRAVNVVSELKQKGIDSYVHRKK